MKSSFGFDTSALISLGHSGLLEHILEQCSVVITSSVRNELSDIGRFQDTDAKMARVWINHIKDLKILPLGGNSDNSNPAEDDLASRCRFLGIPMVTDDLGAFRRHCGNVMCLFSSHIVYYLMKIGAIDRMNAIHAIKKKRSQRDWKNNIIHVVSMSLFTEK